MSYQYMVEDYQKMYQEIKIKTSKVMWIITILIYLLTATFFVLFSKESGLSVVVIVFISGSGIMTILSLLISTIWFDTNKPLFKVLLPAALNEVAVELGVSLKMDSFVKEKEYIRKGGLFTRGSSVVNDWKIEGVSNDGFEYKIYDSLVFTQADKSRVEHFKGIYYILDTPNNKYFQLRDKSKPRLKGVKFTELHSSDNLKDFVAEGEYKSIDSRFYKLFDHIKVSEDVWRLFIGGVDGELHIALYKAQSTKKIKILNEEIYSLIKEEIKHRIKIIEEFYSIINS